MTSIRKLFVLVVALVITAFALPSFAAQPAKMFGLTMDTVPPGSFVAGANTVSATYTNLTPNGNSAINWVYLSIPIALAPNLTAADVHFGAGGGAVYSIDTTTVPGYKTIVVNGISGVLPGLAYTFTVDVVVPASPSCANYQFKAQAFTGNSGTQGQPFAYQATLAPTWVSKDSIAIVSGCSLKFDAQPTSADVNATITSVPYTPSGAAVKVGIYDTSNNLVTTFSGSATLTFTPGTNPGGAGLSGARPANFTSGYATFAPSINAPGQNYQLRATLGGGVYVDSTPFWITGVGGTVDCTDGTNYTSSDGIVDPKNTYIDFLKSDPGDWGVRRGPNSLDGTNNNCKKVGVSVNLMLNGTVLQFLYDKSIPNQVGNFKYWIIWPETTVNPLGTGEKSNDGTSDKSTAGFGEKRPLVSWVTDAGVPKYVPVLNCASDDLNQGSALMPVLPNVSPFTDSGQYTEYTYDGSRKAKVCLAQHIMISSGTDGSGVFQVIYADKIVDQVDTFVKQP